MDWSAEIAAAAERIKGHVLRTPVVTVENGFGLDFPVQMKLEQMQHTGTFKARGAFNTLLSSDVPAAGLVAASGGNHGAAVAYAAHKLGHKARIYVPEMAGPAKVALIRDAGADLAVVPGAYSDALDQALAYEAETGAMQIHAYDALGTVGGQGTVALEWEEQGLDADTVIIAVGGGGLIGGSMAWFDGRRRVIAVEPETSCALNAALKAGEPVDVEVSGVAANALGAKRIGQICFDLAVSTGAEVSIGHGRSHQPSATGLVAGTPPACGACWGHRFGRFDIRRLCARTGRKSRRFGLWRQYCAGPV